MSRNGCKRKNCRGVRSDPPPPFVSVHVLVVWFRCHSFLPYVKDGQSVFFFARVSVL